MKLLYFDHIDGEERLLNIEFDAKSLTVKFDYDQDKDPTHDEENQDVKALKASGVMKCTDKDQFDGFARALVKTMPRTGYTLQDPAQPPFNRISADKFNLDEFGPGVPPEQLTCKIPAEVVPYIVRAKRSVETFKNLIDPTVLKFDDEE